MCEIHFAHVSGGKFVNGGGPQETIRTTTPYRGEVRRMPLGAFLALMAAVGFVLVGGFFYLDSRIDGIQPQIVSPASVQIVTEVVTLPPTVRPGMIQVGSPQSTGSTLPTLAEKSSLIPTSTTTSFPTSASLPSMSPSTETTPPVVASTVEETAVTADNAPASPSVATPLNQP